MDRLRATALPVYGNVGTRRRLAGLVLAIVLSPMGIVGCGSSTAPGASGGVVGVQARDYAFDPATTTVRAGPSTFEVRNVGGEEHEFEILRPDGSVVDEIEGLVPGLSRRLTVDLPAGEYRIVCRLNDHEQRGMKGTLTVSN